MDKDFEKHMEQYMKNSNQIDEHKEIWKSAGYYYSKRMNRYDQLKLELLEYMGYDDAFLKTKAGLKRDFNKDQLVEIIIRQRVMYRKIFNDLTEDKKAKYISDLDKMYLKKDEN